MIQAELQVQLLHADAKAPTTAYGFPPDLAYDLYALEECWVSRHPCLVRTGIACHGYYLHGFDWAPLGFIIKDRSSMALQGVYTHGGVIDPGYRGEIKVIMSCTNMSPHLILKGAKFAQMVPVHSLTGTVTVVDSLPESGRGTGGFGSSDKI